jgi:MFS family permease
LLHESKDPNATKSVDMIGTALGIPAVGLITLALTQAGEWGWFERRTVGSFIIGVVLLIAFVIRCSRVTNPLLDLSLFKMPFVVAANVSGLFFSIGFLGMWLLNTYWVQAVWHYSPARSGLATAPGPMMAALLAAPMGRMATRYGHARVLLFGSFLLAIGTFGLGQTMTTTPKYLTIYLPWMLITGAGVGCSISTLSSSASAFLPPARFAMGSALNTTARQVGSALGAALATSLTISAMATVNKWNGLLMGAKELLATSPAKAQAAFQAIVPPTRGDLASYFNAYRTMAAIYLFAGIIMITLYRKPTDRQMAEANNVEFVD